jgi:hypothetical protein
VVLLEPPDQLLEVLGEVAGEALSLAPVVEAVADQHEIDAGQLGNIPGVASLQQAVDVLAVAALVNDLSGRQVALGGEQLADDVLQVVGLRDLSAADAPDDRAVPQQQDANLRRLRIPSLVTWKGVW